MPLIMMLISSWLSNFSNAQSQQYGLLTQDYGIITQDDLAYDRIHREITPYNPNRFSSALYWQCFPSREVKVEFEKWKDEYEKKTKCAVSISVKHNNELQTYVMRRAYDEEYCRHFIKEWNKTSRGQDILCINGEGGEYQKSETGRKYKLWVWEKLKTKLGCYSYFEGSCDTVKLR